MAKKIFAFLVLLAFLSFGIVAHAAIRNVQDNFRFVYNIIDTSGNHVTGQTVTVQIQKASNGYWYDFSDDTFKNSGWTNKTTNLTEDATNGVYYYTFNPPASETAADEYVFLVDNSDATYGDHQSMAVQYQSIGTSTVTVAGVWDELQSGHTTAGSFGKYLDTQVSTSAGTSVY